MYINSFKREILCIHPSVNVRLYSEAGQRKKTFLLALKFVISFLKVEVILFYHHICEVLVGGMKAYKWHIISFDFSEYDFFHPEHEVPFSLNGIHFGYEMNALKSMQCFKSNSNQRHFNIP